MTDKRRPTVLDCPLFSISLAFAGSGGGLWQVDVGGRGVRRSILGLAAAIHTPFELRKLPRPIGKSIFEWTRAQWRFNTPRHP
ncbi:hypothetical protein L207DRAFT_141491 [Hyaloscypha variabilis F]|uniref:Uncharacterized protein n=1 Tax=Hyaloscypha variabilis (strain UAMH 11265 / GT02V1 / F) TaxID=1149755 RepID=A0A2J6R7M3_HYAVF|nr:hypothetical protein L207DRAFT_141491 [Hyaloscypha variabilis F]